MHLVLLFHYVFAFAAPPLLPDSPDTDGNVLANELSADSHVDALESRLHPRLGRRVGALDVASGVPNLARRVIHFQPQRLRLLLNVRVSELRTPSMATATIRAGARSPPLLSAPQAPPCAHPPPPPNPRLLLELQDD